MTKDRDLLSGLRNAENSVNLIFNCRPAGMPSVCWRYPTHPSAAQVSDMQCNDRASPSLPGSATSTCTTLPLEIARFPSGDIYIWIKFNAVHVTRGLLRYTTLLWSQLTTHQRFRCRVPQKKNNHLWRWLYIRQTVS